MDSMKVANKILSAQKFKKADEAERKQVVKTILANGHEHKSGKEIVSKVAAVVANTHLSYHQRMQAMKKLLDDQTDAIKQKPLHRVDEPKHADKKVHVRGRSGHRTKAQEADDNKKAMSQGAKLLAKKEEKTRGVYGHYLHSSSSHDKKLHEESEHKAADPAKANAWMKKQLGEVVSSATKYDKSHAKAQKETMTAKAAKALKDGQKLMHETVIYVCLCVRITALSAVMFASPARETWPRERAVSAACVHCHGLRLDENSQPLKDSGWSDAWPVAMACVLVMCADNASLSVSHCLCVCGCGCR